MGVGSGTAHPQGMRSSGPDAAPPSIADLVSTDTLASPGRAGLPLWITVCPGAAVADVLPDPSARSLDSWLAGLNREAT
jgi:hypothetical protein